MPATKDDILSLLRDPTLMKINFSVGEIVVSGPRFGDLIDYFEDGDISVGVGPAAGAAEYWADTKTLNVDPAANSPLTFDDKGLLLHELVHAMSDVRGVQVRRLDDEIAAYLSQVTYMQINKPSPHMSWFKIPPGRPLTLFTAALFDVVDAYKLTERWARINEFDIFSLSEKLLRVAKYADISFDARSAYTGVPIKGRDLRALRMAIRLAHQPRAPLGG
jgi:hypothetical protein